MFNLFNNDDDKDEEQELFEEKRANAANAEVAPGTGITYKKDLIHKYKGVHQLMLSLFGAANKAYEKGKYDDVADNLYKMQVALRTHLLDEEINFYVYVLHCYEGDKEATDLIAHYKKDIKKVGNAAFSFLKKYSALDNDIATDSNFLSQFQAIGEVLVKRIDSEENHLYPLYQPPSKID